MFSASSNLYRKYIIVLFLLIINAIYLLIYSLTSIETTTSRKRIPDPEGGCTYFRYLGRPDSDAGCPRGHKLPGKRHRIYATYNLRPKWYPYFDFFLRWIINSRYDKKKEYYALIIIFLIIWRNYIL